MMKLDDQQKEDILAKAGLLDPIPTQLFRYYGQVLSGDLDRKSVV